MVDSLSKFILKIVACLSYRTFKHKTHANRTVQFLETLRFCCCREQLHLLTITNENATWRLLLVLIREMDSMFSRQNKSINKNVSEAPILSNQQKRKSYHGPIEK